MSKSAGASISGTIPKRPYGKSGVELSIIGFGGIVVMNADQDHAYRVVAEAVERGVNYFDVAPSYGNAEEKLGPALEPFRKDCFLACKTGERSCEGAEREFLKSLENLRTDYFDLYQLHGITEVEKDVDAAFSKGGVMEFIEEQKAAGRIRYVGFSAHSDEAALAALDRYDFDSVLFPLNFATFYKGNFGRRILEKAVEKGAARLALKGMARQHWPDGDPDREKYGKCWYQPMTDPEKAEVALRFTLSQPITAAIPPGEEAFFRMALNIAMRFKPVSDEEIDALKKEAEDMNVIFSTV